jgi:transcriptional regulator with XRE-family HTH domain
MLKYRMAKLLVSSVAKPVALAHMYADRMESKSAKPVPSTLGARLKEARKIKKKTQEQVAELFDIGKAAVSQWEKNGTVPETDRIAPLCDFLKVSADYILRGVDAPYITPDALRIVRMYTNAKPEDQIKIEQILAIYGPAASDEKVEESIGPAPTGTETSQFPTLNPQDQAK